MTTEYQKKDMGPEEIDRRNRLELRRINRRKAEREYEINRNRKELERLEAELADLNKQAEDVGRTLGTIEVQKDG